MAMGGNPFDQYANSLGGYGGYGLGAAQSYPERCYDKGVDEQKRQMFEQMLKANSDYAEQEQPKQAFKSEAPKMQDPMLNPDLLLLEQV